MKILALITNIINHAHDQKNVLFQTQKPSYISRNLENSWVGGFKHDISAVCLCVKLKH